MTKYAVHVFVSGVVQGVGFRAFSERTARKLGLTGWVRNLADGRVELLAEGDRQVIDALIAALADGPRGASVDHLEVVTVAPSDLVTFTVRPTGP